MAVTLSSPWRFGLSLAAVLLVTVQLYGPNLDHSFQFDDDKKLLDNRHLSDPARYLATFGQGYYDELAERFLPNLTFAWNYAAFGFESFGWHLTNLIFHLVNVVLLAFFGRALLRRAGAPDDVVPLLAAALFAVHTLNSEAVNYCNARPNLMVTTFYLVALCAALRASEPPAPRRRPRVLTWGAFGVAVVLALLCKSLAATIAVMAPLVLFWVRDASLDPPRSPRRALAAGAGLLALGVGIAFATGAVFEVRRAVVETGNEITGHWFSYLVVTVLGQSEIFVRYLGLAVFPWPGHLNIDHRELGHLHMHLYQEQRVVDGAFGVVLVPLLSFGLLLAVVRAAFLWRRREPVGTFLVLWPFVTQAPNSLVPRGEVMVEYRTYLPMVGLCLLIAWLLRRGGVWVAARVAPARARLLLRAGAALLVGLLTLGTRFRNQAWATPETMWQDSLRKAPRNPRALNGLGNTARLRGDVERAIAYFRAAVEIDPRYVEAQNNLGALLAQQGDLEGALPHLARVVGLAPDQADAYNNIGNVFTKMGRLDEAIRAYRRALELDPGFGEAEGNLGMAVARKGDPEAALAHYRRSIELSPRFAVGHMLVGRALVAKGEVDAGIASFRRALDLAPSDPRVHLELGKALGYRHDVAGARRHLRRALELDPGNREARAYLESLPGD